MAETQIAEQEFVPDATRVMDRALKAKWVDALRSGEFKLGHYKLRTKDGSYCCLGVLCVLAGIEIAACGTLPAGAHNYFPIYDLDIPVTPGLELIRMNDDLKNDFVTIADYVEETL